MSNPIKASFLVDDNGQMLEIVDQTARDKVAELQENNGIDTVTVSGAVASLEYTAGADIKIASDTANPVTLIHQGKNFCPSINEEITKNGLTAKPNADGSLTVKGTATALTFFDFIVKIDPKYLPAGTYRFATNGLGDNGDNEVSQINKIDDTPLVVNDATKPDRSFTLTEGAYIYSFIRVSNGTVVDTTYKLMLERTDKDAASEYEKYSCLEYDNVKLPLNVSAFDGENIFYTESGDVLTCTASKSLTQKIEEVTSYATYTDVVVSTTQNEGTKIQVDADASGVVTLIHQGKNFMPIPTAAGTNKGVEYTPNSDGTVTLVGTTTDGIAYIDCIKRSNPLRLPAGTYALRLGGKPDYPIHFALGNASDGSTIGIARSDLNYKISFEIAEPTEVFGYIGVSKGYTVDNTVWVQLERVSSTSTEKYSDFEVYKKNEYSVSLPTTISAMKGTNVLYTASFDELKVKVKKSDGVSEEVVGEIVRKIAGFDPSVWGLPVLELHGDVSDMTKDVSVDLEYTYLDERDKENVINLSGVASVKWQGSSSISYAKKNYTVKFDQAFEAAEGWGAQKKYCFKANYIDHSHSRNLVNAKLWGQIVKKRSTVPTELANLPNAGAVDGFPCIIVLNGKFHGLYTFNIPKDGWMMGMGNGTQECILCADKWDNPTGFKAEAVVDTDFSLEYVTNEDDMAWVTTSLNRLINACINSNGTDLDTTIAQYLDWQSAIDYYIFCVLIEGADMTRKNYLLSTFDGTKWFFGAYDMDCTYGLHWNGGSWFGADYIPTFEGYAAEHRVMELIKTHKKDQLKARYTALRNSVLSESNLAKTFANFAGQIPDPVYIEDVKTWPMLPNTSVNNIGQIRDYYRLRCALADKWMEAL